MYNLVLKQPWLSGSKGTCNWPAPKGLANSMSSVVGHRTEKVTYINIQIISLNFDKIYN